MSSSDNVSRLVLLAVLLVPAVAHAGDPCAEGEAALRLKDLTRASITVDECTAVDAAKGAALAAKVDQAAEAAGYATIDITTKPEGATVIVDTAKDRPFVSPRQVWVASGLHDVTALVDGAPVSGSTFRIAGGERGLVMIDLPPAPVAGEVKEVDFGEDGGPPELTTGGPADEKFGSLLPERYLRGIGARGETEAAKASRAEGWIGGGLAARDLTVAIAVAGRYRLAGERASIGLAVDGVAMGGSGFGLVGAGGFVTGGYTRGVRVTLGVGAAIATYRLDGEAARDVGLGLYGELARGRISLVGRGDGDGAPDRFVLMFGVRW